MREAEEAGEVAAVSLSDMRVVFERVSPSLIARVAAPAGIELAESLADLQERARLRRADAPESLDAWVRIEVTPDIVVSVRGVGDEDRGLVERVRWAMARVISARWRAGRG